jgi:hypothetical protein
MAASASWSGNGPTGQSTEPANHARDPGFHGCSGSRAPYRRERADARGSRSRGSAAPWRDGRGDRGYTWGTSACPVAAFKCCEAQLKPCAAPADTYEDPGARRIGRPSQVQPLSPPSSLRPRSPQPRGAPGEDPGALLRCCTSKDSANRKGPMKARSTAVALASAAQSRDGRLRRR